MVKSLPAVAALKGCNGKMVVIVVIVVIVNDCNACPLWRGKIVICFMVVMVIPNNGICRI